MFEFAVFDNQQKSGPEVESPEAITTHIWLKLNGKSAQRNFAKQFFA